MGTQQLSLEHDFDMRFIGEAIKRSIKWHNVQLNQGNNCVYIATKQTGIYGIHNLIFE